MMSKVGIKKGDKMTKSTFSVDFYETTNGDCPAEEFINAQNKKMQAKILRTLSLLQERGNDLRMPYSEHLEDGIFQIRAQVGSDITRVLYFFVVGKKIIVTNGFAKKTQETPPPEIELAKKYRADYLSRRNI